MQTITSGLTAGPKLQHTFKLQDGHPVLPKAESLEQAQEHGVELLLSGSAYQLDQQVDQLLKLSSYDQSWLDLDPRPNHLVYSSSAHNAGPAPWGKGAWPGDDTLDIEMTMNDSQQVVSMRAYGPSQMGKDNFERGMITDWNINYSNTDGVVSSNYESGQQIIQLVRDTNNDTLTVTTQATGR